MSNEQIIRGFVKLNILTGKELRQKNLTGRMPCRIVPAFSLQSLQPNTKIPPPPKTYPYKQNPVKRTFFKYFYFRGDIPFCYGSACSKLTKTYREKEPPSFANAIKWYCNPNDLDYCYYLPIFIDGLADNNDRLRMIARKAALELIFRNPHKILPVLPQLILPFKRAFNTRIPKIVVTALKVMQQLVLRGPCVGEALVPYYRQILPICAQYKEFNVNIGDMIDNDTDFRLGDVISETLEILEKCGGPHAYINIKYMIPTYESCVDN